ncbi:MAG: family transporter [Thermoleophilia bacterium]|nr:family transporter [Thermoleophilia bacterium]
MTDPVDSEAPAPTVRRLQVPPWVQFVGLPMVVVFGYLFARAASHALVVFLIAGLISLLLAPVVRSLVAAGIPRLASVLLVFGMFATLVTVVTIGVVDLVAEQAVEIRNSSSEIGDAAVERIDELQEFVDDRGWDVSLREQGVRFVDQLEERSTELSGEALEFGREFVTIVAEAAFNVVLIVVITIYMLLDAPRISRAVASIFPRSTGVDQLFGRMEKSLLRYTVGQALASIVMGVSAMVGLWIMGWTGIWETGGEYAVLFGLFVALTEFAPSIGPAISSIPPIVAAMFDGPGPTIAVIIFFLLLHQIEGHIVIPKLMGAAIAVHPLLVIFGILAGAQLMGIGGILLALPLLAVGRVVVVFIRERVALGSWVDPIPSPVMAGAAAAGAAPDSALGSEARAERAGDARREALGARVRGWISARRRGGTQGQDEDS